ITVFGALFAVGVVVTPWLIHTAARTLYGPPVVRRVEVDRQEIVKGELVKVTVVYDAPAGESKVELVPTEGVVFGKEPTFVLSTTGITRAAPFPIFLTFNISDKYGRTTRFDYTAPIMVVEKKFP